MPTVHERIFALAEILYQRALARFQAEQFRRAEVNASAASGAAIFVEQDTETPQDLRDRARALANTLEAFLSDIWREQTHQYGDRFLSGPKERQRDTADREAALFICELREAMGEVTRLGS